jgi:hypothetical protein
MLLAAAAPVLADEGMWTFDNFPVRMLKQTHGANITPAWLDHIRLSTVRLANCTASFVSPQGLILTSHHCVEPCLEQLSGEDQSLDTLGFAAPELSREKRCVTQVADVLVGIQDITVSVAKSTTGLDAVAANDTRKKVLTALEQNCERESQASKYGRMKCQSVKLYQGGRYFLYKYKRYDDVRLVFAPEAGIAAFGGDPDNFQFPRWSLDFAVLRVYESGKPAKTANYLKINFDGPREHELVFISGHPGRTAREHTRAQLDFDRDVFLPTWLLRSAELRGRYIQFGKNGDSDERILRAPLDALENEIKMRRKQLDAVHDEVMLARKTALEANLRARLQLTGSDPWNDIAQASLRERAIFLPYTYLENGAGFNSGLFRYARVIVRGAEERAKPNVERLREYVDTALPRLEQQLFAPLSLYPRLETMTLSFSLQRMREWLGPDHVVVRRLLAQDSPDSLAARLVEQTKLTDPLVRRQLWDGRQAAVEASHDPMLELARSIDVESRAVRRQFEDTVEAPLTAATERIANARLGIDGATAYPDATFTLRLNYGTVQGWVEDGVRIDSFTHLDRAFERATGAEPFKIPDSWMKARGRLDMRTPFCIATDNDMVGGNSGSPLIDIQGRIVGVMFDGNIHSIAGYYWFDGSNNRAIGLHPAIIREALDKVYGARALLAELGAK